MGRESQAALTTRAEEIRDETVVKANTRLRHHNMLVALIDTLFSGIIPSVTDTTNTDTYVGTIGAASYYTGMILFFEVDNTNTANDPTLNLDGLGAKVIKGGLGEVIGSSSRYLDLNSKVLLIYDGTNFKIVSGLGEAQVINTVGQEINIASTNYFKLTLNEAVDIPITPPIGTNSWSDLRSALQDIDGRLVVLEP